MCDLAEIVQETSEDEDEARGKCVTCGEFVTDKCQGLRFRNVFYIFKSSNVNHYVNIAIFFGFENKHIYFVTLTCHFFSRMWETSSCLRFVRGYRSRRRGRTGSITELLRLRQ
jgi:hypothetical protein